MRWRLYADHPVPARALCSTAFCFAFKDGKIALTRHHRGWDIPGGHAERGESMEEAIRRETYEETGLIVGDLEMIAVHRVDHAKPHERDGRPYPFPTNYGLWYAGRVIDQRSIPNHSESVEMAFFTPEEFRTFKFDFQPCLDIALEHML